MIETSTQLPIHRLDAELYGRIVESGALEGQRVELIDGIIVEMSPQSTQHSFVIQRLTRLLAGEAAYVRVQSPLQVAGDSVPEPALAVVLEPERPDRHPSSAVLVAEVAVSSHALDRGRKAELYAAAGVPTYWLIDVPARAVEVRTDPGPTRYRTLRTLHVSDVLPSPCAGIDDLPVDALLESL